MLRLLISDRVVVVRKCFTNKTTQATQDYLSWIGSLIKEKITFVGKVYLSDDGAKREVDSVKGGKIGRSDWVNKSAVALRCDTV